MMLAIMANSTPYLQMAAGFGIAQLDVTSGMLTDGVLAIPIDGVPPKGGVLVLADGVALSGVVMTENALDINDDYDVACASLVVLCPSGSATLKHEDTNVPTATQRLRVELSGTDLVVTPGRRVQLLYDTTGSRWAVYDEFTVHEGKTDPHPQYMTATEAAAAAPVQSVNGSTGAVTLDATDVGADASGTAAAAIAAHVGASDPHSQYTTTGEAAAAAPVQSVNGTAGVVVLDASDVGADAVGTAASAVASHEAESNPHPQYTRSLRYSGTTSGAGTYSATFPSAFTNTPNVQANLIGSTVNQFVIVASRSTTGFTVTAYERAVTSLLGVDLLTGSPTATNGLAVDVLVTSND